MSVCVIFNPAAGRRRAKRRMSRFLATHRHAATFWPTERAGHAVELARRAAEEGFTTVAAAGGDGTAHDVAVGLLESGRDVLFAVLPIGSANDYAHSVAHQFGIDSLNDGNGHLVDVGLIRAGGRQRYFIECVGTGLAGQVTIEASRVAHLQGVMLYGLAAWRALKHVPSPPDFEFSIDGGPWETHPTLTLSLLIGRREGNFLLAPEAVLDDGLFDVAHARKIGRWKALGLLPRLALVGPPRDHPEIRLGRCARLLVRSPVPLAIHTDGEVFCTPADGVRDLEVEILPRRLRVKVCSLSR